jgi:hypothetical protein
MKMVKWSRSIAGRTPVRRTRTVAKTDETRIAGVNSS